MGESLSSTQSPQFPTNPSPLINPSIWLNLLQQQQQSKRPVPWVPWRVFCTTWIEGDSWGTERIGLLNPYVSNGLTRISRDFEPCEDISLQTSSTKQGLRNGCSPKCARSYITHLQFHLGERTRLKGTLHLIIPRYRNVLP